MISKNFLLNSFFCLPLWKYINVSFICFSEFVLAHNKKINSSTPILTAKSQVTIFYVINNFIKNVLFCTLTTFKSEKMKFWKKVFSFRLKKGKKINLFGNVVECRKCACGRLLRWMLSICIQRGQEYSAKKSRKVVWREKNLLLGNKETMNIQYFIFENWKDFCKVLCAVEMCSREKYTLVI